MTHVPLGGPLAVPWKHLDSQKYEDLVAAMLSLEHPNARRMDGSGGDGGRDVSFHDADGLHVFELKSFTGRVSAGRRTQIRKSLLRAAELNPCEWQLVVPINPTPAEDDWFGELTATVPFPCEWRGATWLDAHMASRASLVRYFCGTGAEELLVALDELRSEQVILANGDISSAMQRLKALAVRIDGLNPFHRLSITVDGGHVAAIPTPRYPGAEDDYPLTINATFTFPRSADGKKAQQDFERYLSHGERVVLDSRFVESFKYSWLPGIDYGSSAFELILDGESTWDQRGTLIALSDRGDEESVVSSLSLQFMSNRGGELARSVIGTDASGVLKVTVTLDQEAGHTSIGFAFDATGVLPSSAAPAVDMLRKIGDAAAVTVRFDDLEVTVAPIGVPVDARDRLVATGELCIALAELQTRSGRYFGVPPDLDGEDLGQIREASRLLAGETIEGTWSRFSLGGKPERVPELLEVMRKPGVFGAISTTYLELGGNEVPLGVVCHTYIDAVPEDPAAVAAAAAAAQPSDAVEVVLVPADGEGRMTRRVLTQDEVTVLDAGQVAPDELASPPAALPPGPADT